MLKLIKYVSKTITAKDKFRTKFRLFFRPKRLYNESKSPYSVRIQENTDQKKSVFGHFSRSASA